MKLENIEKINIKQSFVETEYINNIAKRAMFYLNTGYAIHFKGPSGAGKTTLALYIAKLMERPVQIIFGNEEFGRTDLIGGNFGVSKKFVHDNYIHSVTKHQVDYSQKWVDGRLMDACKNGAILIYDEFTRSRAEANNVLLSILEEGVVEVPLNREKTRLVKVHPDFRIIFTSNPEEYSGIYKAQDALKSRMITLELDFPDAATELEIVMKGAEIDKKTALYIVDAVRNFRERSSSKFHPTIRSSIMIANIVTMNKLNLLKNKELVRQIFEDVLLSESSNIQVSLEEKIEAQALLDQIISSLDEKQKSSTH